MKTSRFFSFSVGILMALGGLLDTHSVQAGTPVISSVLVEGDEVVVTVEVPEGLRKVTLECRERLGPGGWEPRAVARLEGSGGTVVFRLPISRAMEMLRVKADSAEPLPDSFYAGETSYEGAPDSSGGVPGTAGPYYLDSAVSTPPTQESAGREVVESDIWKVHGETLYFFNQYRGLQVIDLADPDEAVLRGTLDLPAAGEQMYLLGERHVLLLARNGCNSSYGESEVLVLEDGGTGDPAVVASLPVKGNILESRLVGSALYVASQTYRSFNDAEGTTWQWGTVVSAFDLSDAGAPVARNELWYSGYGNVVASTDTLFFVVTQDPGNWWQSLVRVIDITSPDGTMASYESIRVAGRVMDKFKLNYAGGILTTISEDRHWDNGQRLSTVLETFRLPDPRSLGPVGVVKLGELELGRGESLQGTRFDGDKVYIVTFFRIDPLFVVSLADPSHPRIVGEVEVPGFSSYIHPLGDRLVTVGVETNRVAVSLFDVSDPAEPSLLSRVLLGERYSWSEANRDEKAFTLLAEEGLILIPYNGYEAGGYASQVQLIDLNRDHLAARGIIEHELQPRRAAVYGDRILSISGWELMTVDATDRDHPVVMSEVELAWPVDQVFVKGDYLVELATSTWGIQKSPALRVAGAAAPHAVLGGLPLKELSVWGASVKGDYLYVLQGASGRFPWIEPIPLEGGADGVGEEMEPRNSVMLTVISLKNLPALEVVGETEAEAELMVWGANLEAVWPSEGTLIWVGGQQYWYWYDIAMPAGGVGDAIGLAAPWFWGGAGGNLLAFDVADPSSPSFASELSLGQDRSWWSFSEAFTADGLVFLSHESSQYIKAPTASEVTVGSVAEPVTGDSISLYPDGRWVRRTFLDVVDYRDPRHPTVRRPVNIPAPLTGISRGGSIIYTVGPRWKRDGTTDWLDYLSAGAYDGVSVHRVDSIALSPRWPRPVLVQGEYLYVGVPPEVDAAGHESVPALEAWTLPDSGKFARLSITPLDSAANALAGFPGMVAVQGSDRFLQFQLFDTADPTRLGWVGAGGATGCLWADLNRADGAVDRGLWLPLGVYGVSVVPVMSR